MLTTNDLRPVLRAQLEALQAEDSRLQDEQNKLADVPATQRLYDRLNARIMRNKGKMNAVVWMLQLIQTECLTDLVPVAC